MFISPRESNKEERKGGGMKRKRINERERWEGKGQGDIEEEKKRDRYEKDKFLKYKHITQKNLSSFLVVLSTPS